MNQQERLTEYLEKHGKIDPLKAWTQLGIYRLADTVFNLRKKGYDITTTNKKVKNKFKEVCVVAEYKLEQRPMIYSIDFESRSAIDLKDRGLDVYANDPTTEVICVAFGTQPNDVLVTDQVNNPHYGHFLSKLLDHVNNGGKIQAWNAMFEYAIWNCVCVPKYGWPPLKLEQCIDSMAIAAANNVPQSLDDAGAFMDSTHKKDAIGARLIQKLCKPNRKGEFENDPELLQQLFDCCAQDVRTEMAIVKLLRPLTADEQRVWELTQRINLRGVPVDSMDIHRQN